VTARAVAIVLALAVLAVGACSPAPDPPTTKTETPFSGAPVGAEAYREILRTEAGIDLEASELAEIAAREVAWIEERLDALAPRVDPDRLDDHPTTPESVVAAYQREVERAWRFVLDRDLATVPDGPLVVELTPESLPEGRYPLVAYLGYRLAITAKPDRLEDHSWTKIPPFAVHETFPGHHLAFLHQRSVRPDPGPEVMEIAQRSLKNRFYHEGWGQTAELLMLEAGYFSDDPAREVGAWRSLLLRAERARLDARLHLGEITPEEAVDTLVAGHFSPETARAEVAKHLDEPGMKAAYLVGALQILALRREVRRAREDAGLPFDSKAFVDRLLAWPLPIPEAARLRFWVELPPELPTLAAVFEPPPLAGDGDIIAPP
jgi:uncharacterized protein (DUF885 family)